MELNVEGEWSLGEKLSLLKYARSKGGVHHSGRYLRDTDVRTTVELQLGISYLVL